ncbi:hypothetical protein ACFQ6B_23675 [Streptomyces wedmorensis]|uniref:DUF2933 domain-containing protein n=1 Tax=Streptomyces wedmorensis TaxID=43759 RepID=A0ABW6J867_STRWE
MSPISHALAVLICALLAFSEAIADHWVTFAGLVLLGACHLLALAKERP